MKFFSKRANINTVLTVSASLSAISGIFMLFHYESQFTKTIHELGAIVLLISGLLHAFINRKALLASVKGRMRYCIVIIALCTAVMIATGDRDFEKNDMLEHYQEYLEELQNTER